VSSVEFGGARVSEGVLKLNLQDLDKELLLVVNIYSIELTPGYSLHDGIDSLSSPGAHGVDEPIQQELVDRRQCYTRHKAIGILAVRQNRDK